MMILSNIRDEIANGFRSNRGVCGVKLYPPIDPTNAIMDVIVRYRGANPDGKIFIIVDSYETRRGVRRNLKDFNVSEDKITILSQDYINPKFRIKADLLITIGVNDNILFFKGLKRDVKFMLVVITKNNMDNDFNIGLSKLMNIITMTNTAEQVGHDNIYSPVEEGLLSVLISDDDRADYVKQSDYIATSITIFGDFSNIDKCRVGDAKTGISASDFRNRIARDNGWSSTLDTTMDFNKSVDAIYNPNSLFERANNVYDIIRKRRNLILDNDAKLDVIKKLVEDNPNKKILILSKRGEFASRVTKHLNSTEEICVDFHDHIESAIALDNDGYPILVKSGENKGKPRIIGAQAISTINMKRFNSNDINVMSIKNASNNRLKVNIDILIITSTDCEDIYTIKRRFEGIKFNDVPNKVYTLYCGGTFEHNKATNLKSSNLHTITNLNVNSQEMTTDLDSIILTL